MPMQPTDSDFLEVIARNRGRILRFASVYAHTAADREDLFQEIVFAIWRALPGFRGDADVRTFVYRIALRVALRFARGQQRRRDGRARLMGIRIDEHAEDASIDLIRREQVEALRAAIRRLDELDRLLVTLHLEGMAAAEIAEVAGLTPNHVSVRLQRARRKLGTRMEKAS